MRSIILITMLLLSARGYAQRVGNVLFKPSESPRANVIRIYIDREGALYPLKGNFVQANGFTLGQFRKCCGGLDVANLEAYYTYYHPEDFAKVCGDYGVKNFRELQKALVEYYQRSINSLVEELNAKNLVVLIHGFNDETPDDNYTIFERKTDDLLNGVPTVYLEVHWDGLINETKNPLNFLAIWKRAQRNSANAALALRRVLLPVNVENVYVVTHSLGASVGTRLLFNVYNWSLNGDASAATDAQRIYSVSDRTSTPPQPNVVLAMIAPAIPGESTFSGIENTVPKNMGKNYKRIVVGFNYNDYALNKGNVPLLRDHLRTHVGSSSLGADKSDVNVTKRIIQDHREDIVFRLADFSNDKSVKKNEHGFGYYLKRESIDSFLRYTFFE